MSKTKPRRLQAERKLQDILDAHRPLIRRATMAMFVSRFVPALIPIQLKLMLDPLLRKNEIDCLGWQLSPTAILLIVVLTCAIVALVRGVAEYAFVATAGKCGHSLVAQLRVAMYEHILRVPTSYVDRRGTGKVLLRFIGDSDALRSWVSRRAPGVFVERCLLVVLILIMFLVDWRLACVVLIPLPLVWLCARKIGPELFDLTLLSRTRQANLSGDIGNRVAFIRQSKWLDRFRKNRQAIKDRAQAVAQQNTLRDRQAAVLQGTGQFLAFVSVPLLLASGVLLAWQNAITIGQFVAFVWLSAHLAITIHRLNSAVVLQKKADVSAARILKLLERTAETGRSSSMLTFNGWGKSLVFENVRLRSATDRSPINFHLHGQGLKQIENEISIREIIDGLLGFRRLDEGRIVVDGQDFSSLQIESLRQHVGWIVQDPIVIQGTIRENVLMAGPDMHSAQLLERLRLLDPDIDDAWLDREVSFSGHGLTDKDRILISIFRALLNDPKFVFVDLLAVDENTLKVLARAIGHCRNQAMILAAEPVYESFTRAWELPQDRSKPVEICD